MNSNLIANTLVIGGAGYIGTHLVTQLIASGRKVTVLGRSPQNQIFLPKNVTYITGDFAQHDLISKLLDTHQEVIHLAYATVPNTSFENPLTDILQNLPATVQLFCEVAKREIKLVFVSSGGTVYGEAIELPIKENHPTKPISPYGVTKLTIENYAHLYAVTHGLKYVCVRPSNAYGIGQRLFTGQGFIATAMASIMQEIPIKIFGEYGTIRDYIYVTDLAEGIVCALTHGHLSETYNLGTGVGLSNFEIIEACAAIMLNEKNNLKIENMPERAFDVKANVLDATKLQTHTGWEPKTKLEDGLQYVYNWLRITT